MDKKNTKILLRAIGYSFLVLLLVNLIYFIIELNATNLFKNWSIMFKYGTFRINDKLVGLKLWSAKANGLMLLVFLIIVFQEFRKGNFKLKND
jgi:hypothetical protein